MNYLLLLYDEGSANPSALPASDEEMGRVMAAYDAFTKECIERGVYLRGDALQNVGTATTVRVRNGETLTTDGPFAETKEALGGYYLLNCRDLDEALELAAKCPGSWFGSVEVRPIREIPSEYTPEASAAAGAGAGG
ncbi:MAG TPA: YciI family protein [Candidatus Limnocylindrales bacterium]|nr:YciI family protein [Candidatus Limnocylindrales bacterium]